MTIRYRRGTQWCECGDMFCTAMAAVGLPELDLRGLRHATIVVAALNAHRSGGVQSPQDPRRSR